MREARRVARPLIYERDQPFQPRIDYPHEMLGTIEGPLPPVSGYVMTTPKDSPLVEVVVTAPQPSPGGHVLLAGWTYGLGRTVALTTDVGQRWASRLDGLGGLRPVLFTDAALVDAAQRWRGQVRHDGGLARRPGPCHGHGTGRAEPVSQLSADARLGGRPRSIQLRNEHPAGRAGTLSSSIPGRAPGNYFLTVTPAPAARRCDWA